MACEIAGVGVYSRLAAIITDHVVRAQDLERRGECGFRQSMGVDSQEQRTVNALLLSIIANRLRDREDVPFVESLVQRGASMTGGSEGNPLRHDSRVGTLGVVRRHQARDVDEIRGLCRFVRPQD